MPFTVLRFAKLKTAAAVSATGGHNTRTRPTPAANPAGQIIRLLGTDAPLWPTVQAKIGDQKIRKNAVLAVECILSASPDYFRPDQPEAGGTWLPDRLQAWEKASVDWLKKEFGDRLVDLRLHLDEQTPHLHCVLVPLDDNGKLNASAMFGGTRQTLRDYQTRYGKAVAPLGIQRGIEGSKAVHQTVQEYYQRANTPFEPLPAVKTKPVPLPPEPEKPGLFAGAERQAEFQAALADRKKIEARNLQAREERRVRSKAAERLAVTYQAQAREEGAIRNRARQLAEENGKLLRERNQLKQQLENHTARLRALPLADVAAALGGTEDADSHAGYSARKFTLPGGERLGITEAQSVWFDNASQRGGHGAVDLVMYCQGSDFKTAVAWLQDHFAVPSVRAECARVAVKAAEKLADEAVNTPFAMPTPAPTHWPKVKKYLTEKRRLPAEMVDQLHKDGMIYADERTNATFACLNNAGVIKRGTGPQPFHQRLGKGVFCLPGDDQQLFIVEAPIDALSLKALHPTATVVATGGNPGRTAVEQIKQLAAGRRVLLAQDADPAGDRQAALLKAEMGGERLRPPAGGKDWNEHWIGNQRQEQPNARPEP